MEGYNIALLVDSSNLGSIDYDGLLKKGESFGNLEIKEIYMKPSAPAAAVKDAMYRGFKLVIGTVNDADAGIIARGSEIICSPRYDHINMIAIASGDSYHGPLLYLAGEYGKRSLMLAPKGAHSNGVIRATPDYFIELEERVKDGITGSFDRGEMGIPVFLQRF